MVIANFMIAHQPFVYFTTLYYFFSGLKPHSLIPSFLSQYMEKGNLPALIFCYTLCIMWRGEFQLHLSAYLLFCCQLSPLVQIQMLNFRTVLDQDLSEESNNKQKTTTINFLLIFSKPLDDGLKGWLIIFSSVNSGEVSPHSTEKKAKKATSLKFFRKK